MLGYADESGEPGVMKNEHDYFVFCIVLIKDREQMLEICDKIAHFRQMNQLPDDYEFHFFSDSKRIKAEFIRTIHNLDFKFICTSIKKDQCQKTASFQKIADLALELLDKNNLSATIVMDINPRLYRELRIRKKIL